MSAATYTQPWENTLLTFAREARQPAIEAALPAVGNKALLRQAYRECDRVISEHGKTFYLASALLPPAKRQGIRALYAFCRITDDIVDCESGTPKEKETRLSTWREKALSPTVPPDMLAATAWADTRLRYAIPCKYAEQLTAGVARDLYQSRYATFEDLATYMYCVASTVGLMSMHIIGLEPRCSEEEAVPHLIKLGLALQMTNILRDVGEDRAVGRIYLPAEELEAFGVTENDLEAGRTGKRWRDFMRFQIKRNRQFYAQAWPGIAMFRRDGRFAVAAASALYSGILTEIEANQYDVFSRRAHVSTLNKIRRLPGIWWRQR